MPKKNTNCCKIEHSELNTQFNDKKETTTGRQARLISSRLYKKATVIRNNPPAVAIPPLKNLFG
jgi:hypothetical protein